MITTLTGSNTYLLRQELNKLMDRFLAEQGEMGLEKLDGEEADYDRLREAMESLPFLAAKKMVVLRSPGANKQFQENFEKTIAAAPETTDLIIVEPKLDKRLSYYKILKKQTELREFKELDEAQLVNWLIDSAKQAGGEIARTAAALLVKRIGINQQMLHSELLKLLQYDPKVSAGSIELLTEPTPQSSTFDLLDAALAGRTSQALAIYDDQRQQKVEPIAMIGLLAWQLHVLAVVKTAGRRPAAEIASSAKLSPYSVNKSLSLARAMTLPALKDIVSHVHRIDVRLKSESIDADEAMKHLIVRLGQS